MKAIQGNVLFLILLAVALFAALSYAVTQSNRSGGNNISDEDSALIASEITQYAASIEGAVHRMRLVNSCKEIQVSFAFDEDGDGVWYDADDLYHHTNAPSNLSCHVFHPNGGGVTYRQPPSEWLDITQSAEDFYQEIVFTGKTCIRQVGTGDNNCHSNSVTTDEELMFFIPYMKEAVCEKMARRNAVMNGSNIPIEKSNTWHENPYWAGVFVNAREFANDAAPDSSGTMIGSYAGCFAGDPAGDVPGGGYHYYHVLIPR